MTYETARRRAFRAEVRFVTVTATIIALVAIIVGGHLYGRYLNALDLNGRENALEQVRAEAQKLKVHADDLSAQVTDLQTKLNKTQATLDAIMPSENTYNINPNQMLIVAKGRLAIGLIGSPGNEGVTLNINGKQQVVAAGQVINVAPDPSTNCQVSVQSFTMFAATLVATCSGGKS